MQKFFSEQFFFHDYQYHPVAGTDALAVVSLVAVRQNTRCNPVRDCRISRRCGIRFRLSTVRDGFVDSPEKLRQVQREPATHPRTALNLDFAPKQAGEFSTD